MKRLIALLSKVVCRKSRKDGQESAIGLQKGSKSHLTTVELLVLKENVGKAYSKVQIMKKSISHLTIFVVRGNFYEVIGKDNGSIFEVSDPNSGNSAFLLRTFGENSEQTGEVCQYIGIYTGRLAKNISFLPSCECIYLGNFPVETDKFPSFSILQMRSEIRRMAEMCAQAELIHASGTLSQGLLDEVGWRTEKDRAVAITNAATMFIERATREDLIGTLHKWPFFTSEPIDDYLITLAVNEMQSAKAAEALYHNDRRIGENRTIHGMLASCKKMQNGAILLLYPRDVDQDEIVGCAAVHPLIVKNPKSTNDLRKNFLISVWVCDELRGKGYGRKLIKKAASICKGPLLTLIPNDIEDDTIDVLNFFKSCGCKSSMVSTAGYFPIDTDATKPEKSIRILILDDLSSGV